MSNDTTQAQRQEKRIQKLLVDCKHFRGIQNTLCAAGVNIRELTGGPDVGWAVRMPCLPSMDRSTISVSCDKFCALTQEEAEKQLEQEREATARLLKGLNAAHKDAEKRGLKEGNGGFGEIKCPCCENGTLRYSVASYNGHMHGKCTTEGCLAWMK